MSSYLVQSGDTFDTISRRVYGREDRVNLLRSANPGVIEPLSVGVSLSVPEDPEAPRDQLHDVQSASRDEVSVYFNGERFRYWESINVSRSLDNISTIQILGPFDPNNAAMRKAYKPFTFASVLVNIGGEPLFTGTIVDITPQTSSTENTVTVTAYALPGVLHDCTAPPNLAPLEFTGQDIREIATTLAAQYGLSVVFEGGAEPGAVFGDDSYDGSVAMRPSQKIWPFLTGLASERNLVISSDELGRLVFRNSKSPSRASAKLVQGLSPLLSVEPAFRARDYYASIIGIEPAIFGFQGKPYPVKNPKLVGVNRPLVYMVQSTKYGDLKKAVSTKMGRMFANIASYNVMVSNWRDADGNLWSPNTTVILNAPRAMVYSDYEFIVRNVELIRGPNQYIARLNLIMPGSLAGEIPEALPWD